MSWFSNLFRPRVVVQPDAECDALREHKESIEEDIKYKEQRLGSLVYDIDTEGKKLAQLREAVAALREEKERFEDSLDSKRLHETIKNQTNANARLLRALKEAEARANDEATKRINERHYITTGRRIGYGY